MSEAQRKMMRVHKYENKLDIAIKYGTEYDNKWNKKIS
jgi:hypothetical protein